MADRKPFAAPGVTYSGEGDALPLLPEARRAMFVAKLLADTAQVPVWRSTHRDEAAGTLITTNIAGPIERVHVQTTVRRPEVPKPGTPQPLARLVWMPEGFLITPRSPAAPNGYGMPPTSDGRGTPGGPLREVVINRMPGNQYPEALYARFTGGTLASARAVAANLFYKDWERDNASGFGIGLRDNTVLPPEVKGWRPQFTTRFKSNFSEVEGDTWLAHRPTYAGEDPVKLLFRQETNAVRAEVGRAPLGPALRGWNGDLATDIVYQIQYSKSFGHASTKFRTGHWEFAQRLSDRGGWLYAANENLEAGPHNYDLQMAVDVVAFLKGSPEHYAGMIDDWTQGGEAYGWMDMASGPAVLTERQQPPYALTTPVITFPQPINARVTSQIAGGARTWLYSSSTEHDKLGLSGPQDMFVNIYQTAVPAAFDVDPYVTYRGRVVFLYPATVDGSRYNTVAAGMRIRSDGVAMLRVALIFRNARNGPAVLQVQEGQIDEYLTTRVTLASYALSATDASMMGRPRFSASGERMVFSVLRLIDAPAGGIDPDFTAGPGPNNVVGHRIEFVQFYNGTFTVIDSGQLNITPGAFGADGSAHFHAQTCTGECRLFADYEGETLRYATIRVVASSEQHTTGKVYRKSFRGSLVLPSGFEVIYAETTMDTSGLPNAAAAYGYFRHLLPFDIMESGSLLFIEYRLPANDTVRTTGHMIFQGQEVKYAPNPLYSSSPGRVGVTLPGDYLASSDITTLSVHRGVTNAVSFHTRIPNTNGKHPTAAYPGTLVSMGRETAPRAMPRGTTREVSAPGTMEYVLLGPVVVGDGVYDRDESYQRVEELRRASYKGQFLHAGRIESTIGPVGSTYGFVGGVWTEIKWGAWQGEDQYYRACSVDLAAATGIPDLKQNILPIGAL